MSPDIAPELVKQYPPELIQFVTDEAQRDANNVAEFLSKAGLAPEEGHTRELLAGTLLDLGGFVRLRRWEAAGYMVHVDAGLPTACEALNHIINTLIGAAKNRDTLKTAGALGRVVFDTTVSRFAWTARPELGSDVVLDVDDEDALVEAVTQFLWAHRQHTPAPE